MHIRHRARKDCGVYREQRGIALLAVVVVLSTLLLVGVLFAFTVDLDLRASRYYRDAGQAEQIALTGVYRALAELQYDMWGVREKRAFRLADASQKLDDAAYYHHTTNSQPEPIVQARSRWRQTVEQVGGQGVLTDYRWVEVEENEPDPLRNHKHSGAAYHDEFLPEHTDNSDVWELGLHVNRGVGPDGSAVYFEDKLPRSYRSDAQIGDLYGATYWLSAHRQPWDRQWDYIDTRINGDSFYKIFRFELIDPAGKRSTYAGVGLQGKPLSKTTWDTWKTHLGNAANPGGYARDTRGGAVNINQVNSNYAFETYYAQPAPGAAYAPFHYNDAKWIYVYDAAGGVKRGRYAALVWGDCGTPNANTMMDLNEVGSTWSGNVKHTADYFRLLDTAFDPRGGSIGDSIQRGGAGAGILRSHSGGKWYETLGTAIAGHVRASGPLTSRAELNVFLRKTGAGGALDRTRDSDGDQVPDIERDAEIIASLVSVHAFENLMGPHWERDRIVLDALGFDHAADRNRKQTLNATAQPAQSGFTSRSSDGQNTRRAIWWALEDLKFYWGPDQEREGKYTPYSRQYAPQFGAGSRNLHPDTTYQAEEPATSKAQMFSWFAAASFNFRNAGMAGDSPVGWAFDGSAPANPRFVGTGDGGPGRDPRRGDLTRTQTFSWPFPPQINEVGTLNTAKLKDDLRQKQCRGWESLSGGAYHYIEYVHPWDMSYGMAITFHFSGYQGGMGDARGGLWSNAYRNGGGLRMRQFVGGSGDIFADPETRIIHIDSDLDGENGPDGVYAEDYNDPGRWANNAHYLDQQRPSGAQGSGLSGEWPSDIPMVRPTQQELAQGLTCRDILDGRPNRAKDPVVLLTFNKDKYAPDRKRYIQVAWKENWGRYVPSNYLLVLLPTKYNGKTLTLTVDRKGGDRIVDHVELPGNLSQGWSCYDFLANQHPAMWWNTGNDLYDPVRQTGKATPAWRGLSGKKGNNYHYAGPGGNDADAWHHGLNANAITTYCPGAESLPDPRTPSGLPYRVVDVHGRTDAGLNGNGPDDSSFVAVGLQEIMLTTRDRPYSLNSWDRAMTCPLGFFPRPDPAARSGVRPSMFMRTWRDLMRVSPLEQYFTMGYMGQWQADIRKHQEFAIYDGFDNNLDGHTDDLVTAARFPGGYAAPRLPQGHYVGDRSVVGRININELSHPAAIWYCGASEGAYGHQNTIVGRKPLKGYTTWLDLFTRTSYNSTSRWVQLDPPYNMIVWYENLFADASSDHAHTWANLGFFPSEVLVTSRFVHSGNSPVFTVYVTAQPLDEAGNPLAEIKVRCTLERTWDGKANMLDFKWVPSDVALTN